MQYTIKRWATKRVTVEKKKKKRFKDGTKESNYILATRHKWPETEP